MTGLGAQKAPARHGVFWTRLAATLAFAACAGAVALASEDTAVASAVRGLPFTRSFPLEEIGSAPRGARLSFDSFGRLAVVYDGVYSVLNDTVWLDLAENTRASRTMANVVPGTDGRSYYGGRGMWGVADIGPNGRLRPISSPPVNAPEWTLTTNFTEIVPTTRGVYFGGWDGVVFWDTAKNENQFFALPAVARLFTVGEKVYVSAHGEPLHYVDVDNRSLRVIPSQGLSGAVHSAAELDETHTLLAAGEGRLLVFDGEKLEPWPSATRHGLRGRVMNVQRLVEGGVAVAINGQGLFLFSATGELKWSLTLPTYHRVTSLAANEAGVLWVATEDAIEKVFYGSALTTFGQKLGLSLSWPGVFRWNGRLIVSSAGELYEPEPAPAGAANRFKRIEHGIEGGAWAIAASGPHLLVGNTRGVFAMRPDGRHETVTTMKDVARLAIVGGDLCFAIARTEVALLRWKEGRWTEVGSRVAGLGQPAVLRVARRSAWIEYGGSILARLSAEGDVLKMQVLRDLPWKPNQWVSVGIVDDTVVLSGEAGGRMFYDEKTEQFCEAPELEELLNRSPYWLSRVHKDETGVLWASHGQGIVTFTPRAGDYEIDSSTFNLVTDFFPFVHILPGNDVWISAGRSLHHVEDRPALSPKHPARPILVSVTDGQTGFQLFDPSKPAVRPVQLSFAQNSLSFRFFSGSYARRRAPMYEFRLGSGERWTPLDASSLLTLPGLREGSYRLEVRTGEETSGVRLPAVFNFEILPPWHRTWPAYAGYGCGAGLLVLGIVRWTSVRARRRNAELEEIVRERTGQLKVTMEKLNDETRNAATLAERQRLAGEIHDSLQQGLSGLMLQLDATLKLPGISGDVRARLAVARNMVSFTRHEVQHAVWDMESPLLEDTELGDALRKLTGLIGSGGATIDIVVAGTPVSLGSATKHHLLRIAQEAVTNAVRHASASRISVELRYDPEMISLTVVDNGVGFPAADVVTRSIGHFGLRGLRGRVGKVGGELSIESAAGKGTTISVKVPLTRDELKTCHALSGSA